jgi:hypothetical protein
MLKITDFTQRFPVVTEGDRDVKVPTLLAFFQRIGHVDSLLDIGAHSSSRHYAKELLPFTDRYDGIDLIDDPETQPYLTHYYVGNAITYPLQTYDAVICVSTIEHAGVSTYKGDYVQERMKLFERCVSLANKYVWISFPVGQEYVHLNEFAPITEEQLSRWESLASQFKVTERFFYTPGAQLGAPYYEHTKRDVAVKIPYLEWLGCQSLCIMEIEKL